MKLREEINDDIVKFLLDHPDFEKDRAHIEDIYDRFPSLRSTPYLNFTDSLQLLARYVVIAAACNRLILQLYTVDDASNIEQDTWNLIGEMERFLDKDFKVKDNPEK